MLSSKVPHDTVKGNITEEAFNLHCELRMFFLTLFLITTFVLKCPAFYCYVFLL